MGSNFPPSIVAKTSTRKSGFVLNLKGSDPSDPATKKRYSGNNNLADVPVYYEYEPQHYIIYWFFYPFNGWKNGTVNEFHEGDWEHIIVRLDANDRAKRVAYYQHYCDPTDDPGANLPWSEVTKVQGTHPVVYSAKGGHASFAGTSGIYDPPACKSSPIDSVGKGKSWNTWTNTVDARTQPWYGSGVAWGDRLKASSTGLRFYGPPGPSTYRLEDPKTVPEEW